MSKKTLQSIEQAIRNISDYPKPGIQFKDITPLLQNGALFHKAVKLMAQPFKKEKVQSVVAVESRGFIFGAAIATHLGVGFVPVRKKGKLPNHTIAESYALEYGTDTLEIHEDALKKNQKILIVDDLLATGGTVGAVTKLIERLGAKVSGITCLIELSFLNARKKLSQYPIHALIQYTLE
jgi:adenine phosphoribosyltransferase